MDLKATTPVYSLPRRKFVDWAVVQQHACTIWPTDQEYYDRSIDLFPAVVRAMTKPQVQAVKEDKTWILDTRLEDNQEFYRNTHHQKMVAAITDPQLDGLPYAQALPDKIEGLPLLDAWKAIAYSLYGERCIFSKSLSIKRPMAPTQTEFSSPIHIDEEIAVCHEFGTMSLISINSDMSSEPCSAPDIEGDWYSTVWWQGLSYDILNHAMKKNGIYFSQDPDAQTFLRTLGTPYRLPTDCFILMPTCIPHQIGGLNGWPENLAQPACSRPSAIINHPTFSRMPEI